jgi:hypothetical protein
LIEYESSLSWQRSRHCDAGSCVEAAPIGGEVAVRDSKDPDGPVLRFTAGEWSAFLAGVRDGDFHFDNIRS